MSQRIDSLTGLPKGMEEELKRVLAREEGVAVAVLDIDFFHDINVTHGHEQGDKVLQVLASLLAESFPNQAYRISGDEFGVLLPGVSLEQAFLRAETFRTRVESAADRFAMPDGRPVTVTVGVTQYPRDAKDGTGLLRKADAALVAAKEAGRNQVALPPNEDMVMKSCYYPAASLRRLKLLAEKAGKKESALLREALDDILRKYDV
ncbi:MAG TPA: GGDEF domain-containing protein [Symbiobacteriaceae bacterium]|nr:GGDEF domain-containing protein [Symbiobacteriaceae bacterium]